MSFIGAELNDVLWVANRLRHRVPAKGSYFTWVSKNPKFRFRPTSRHPVRLEGFPKPAFGSGSLLRR